MSRTLGELREFLKSVESLPDSYSVEFLNAEFGDASGIEITQPVIVQIQYATDKNGNPKFYEQKQTRSVAFFPEDEDDE